MNRKKLLIEDNPHDRNWYCNQLEEAGYQVEVAAGWGKAQHKIDDSRPDLIVTELIAPYREEIQTLFDLLLYNHRGIPIIIHTAHKSKSATCGAQAYVNKSPDCKDLIDEVDRIVGQSRWNRQDNIEAVPSYAERASLAGEVSWVV
jgi:DNA-binding NtrC family response regulator